MIRQRAKKIIYTIQSALGKYGQRWGCFATIIVNVVEHEIGRALTFLELLATVGAWYMSQSIYVSNYHNHIKPYDRGVKWDAVNDPEFHFWVNNVNTAIEDCFIAINKTPSTNKAAYQVRLYNVYAGHYCLSINGEVINPDPSIDITGATYKVVTNF